MSIASWLEVAQHLRRMHAAENAPHALLCSVDHPAVTGSDMDPGHGSSTDRIPHIPDPGQLLSGRVQGCHRLPATLQTVPSPGTGLASRNNSGTYWHCFGFVHRYQKVGNPVAVRISFRSVFAKMCVGQEGSFVGLSLLVVLLIAFV